LRGLIGLDSILAKVSVYAGATGEVYNHFHVKLL
jgi:hypothetical protein